MKYLLAAVALACATPAVASEEWTYIDTTRNGTVISARTSDLLRGRSNQTTARMWVRLDARRDRTVSWREARVMYVVNCLAETTRAVVVHTFYPDGSNHNDTDPNPEIEFVTPGTIMSIATSYLCSD